MYTIGVFNHLVDIIGKSVVLLVEGIHLKRTTTLTGYTIIVPPRKLWNQDLLVVAHHQEIVDGVFQHVLTTIGQQHLFFRYTIDLTQPNGDHTLLSLIVDASIEAQRLWVEVLDSLYHFLAGLKVKFISVEIIHDNIFFNLYLFLSFFHFHQPDTNDDPDNLTHTADDTHKDAKSC